MPLNSTGKLSLGGTVVGESVNLELGVAAGAANSMVSDANKLLTRKATGPWVFPDDWRGKSRANEIVTASPIIEVGEYVGFTISGGVPNDTVTISTSENFYSRGGNTSNMECIIGCGAIGHPPTGINCKLTYQIT